jgi:hypothetical protein
MRTLLKPAVLASSKVAPTTGGLFQEPSVGVASNVLPRFQPGLIAATQFAAVVCEKDPLHVMAVAADVGAAEQDL